MDDYNSFESTESEEQIKELKENYHKAICDSCDFPIFGIRFKCLNCEDYDLCELCEKKQEQKSTLHDPNHCFLKINFPMDKRYLLTKEPLIKEATYNEERSILHIGCLCDNCKGPIVGSRFVCTNCEVLYNLCEDCEIKSLVEKIHEKYHVFVKVPYSSVNLPEDTVVEIKDEELKKITIPKMPILYEIKESNNIVIDKKRLELRSENKLKIGKKKRVTLDNHFSEKKIRLIEIGDVDALMEIEVESFARPYEVSFFQQMVYLCSMKKNYGLWVVELKINEKSVDSKQKSDSKVVKFFRNIFTKSTEELQTTNTCIGGYIAVKAKNFNAEIISLAVSKKCRGNGLGFYLMEHAKKFSLEKGCNSCSLHVSVYNKVAQELYKKCGYQITNWIKNYYSNEEEDGLIMTQDLKDSKIYF